MGRAAGERLCYIWQGGLLPEWAQCSQRDGLNMLRAAAAGNLNVPMATPQSTQSAQSTLYRLTNVSPASVAMRSASASVMAGVSRAVRPSRVTV